jgi:hypothetical protein
MQALQRAAGLFNAGRLDEARAIALELATAEPGNFLALHLLGAISIRAGRPDEALEYETRALAIHPDDHEALCNRGIALRSLGRVEEALADYDRVLAAKPDFVPALNLKGVALAARNRHAEAVESYSKAIALHPSFGPARFNRSLSRLMLHDFENGFADFEWRWKGSDTQLPLRNFGRPQWTGDDPRGKTILVHAEQGFGDAIQFCRYVPLLAERGARIVLEVQSALEGLFATLPAQIVRMGDPLPPFDLHCPVMSLPFAFDTRPGTIPANVPYLRAPGAHVARWRERLGPRDRPRVALAWAGNPKQANDRNRSMPLAALDPLRDPSWTVYGVQKEIRESDRESLANGLPMKSLADDIEDFRDTAAILELMDVVVTVDSAVAHLAGGMGKPVWVMLTYAPDWRWDLGRDDSAWYPTARLFRQPQPGDWAFVADQVAGALKAHNSRT